MTGHTQHISFVIKSLMALGTALFIWEQANIPLIGIPEIIGRKILASQQANAFQVPISSLKPLPYTQLWGNWEYYLASHTELSHELSAYEGDLDQEYAVYRTEIPNLEELNSEQQSLLLGQYMGDILIGIAAQDLIQAQDAARMGLILMNHLGANDFSKTLEFAFLKEYDDSSSQMWHYGMLSEWAAFIAQEMQSDSFERQANALYVSISLWSRVNTVYLENADSHKPNTAPAYLGYGKAIIEKLVYLTEEHQTIASQLPIIDYSTKNRQIWDKVGLEYSSQVYVEIDNEGNLSSTKESLIHTSFSTAQSFQEIIENLEGLQELIEDRVYE